MKLNTNSNAYIIIYSAIMVVIVAFLLAFVYQALKPMQDANVALDVKKQILYSLNIRDLDGAEAEAKYAEVVKSEPGGRGEFKKPYYNCEVNGKNIHVFPLKGMGLMVFISTTRVRLLVLVLKSRTHRNGRRSSSARNFIRMVLMA